MLLKGGSVRDQAALRRWFLQSLPGALSWPSVLVFGLVWLDLFLSLFGRTVFRLFNSAYAA